MKKSYYNDDFIKNNKEMKELIEKNKKIMKEEDLNENISSSLNNNFIDEFYEEVIKKELSDIIKKPIMEEIKFEELIKLLKYFKKIPRKDLIRAISKIVRSINWEDGIF
jgi:hypothetical protein